ncbi:MAG TPA: RNA polymerase sigma factor [Vicinamibacterales bacterium]|nr:RNA polymerase sigma factor [Vicinamibacterales bacterium]
MDTDAAFADLVARNHRRLAAIARSYARGDAWRDLYQEIVLQLWKTRRRFEGRASPETWVFRVALNTAITFRRRDAVRPRLVQAADGQMEAACGASSGGRSELALLDEFLASLGEIDRAVLLLYLEDLAYREIAGVTGLSEANVGVRLARIKKAFVDRYIGAER